MTYPVTKNLTDLNNRPKGRARSATFLSIGCECEKSVWGTVYSFKFSSIAREYPGNFD